MCIDDMTPVEANEQRAEWAVTALTAFGGETGQNYFGGFTTVASVGDDIIGEVAGDLIANLFHLAVANGVSPETLIDRAMGHFMEESMEEMEYLSEESTSVETSV